MEISFVNTLLQQHGDHRRRQKEPNRRRAWRRRRRRMRRRRRRRTRHFSLVALYLTIQWIKSFLQVRARVHHGFRRPAHLAAGAAVTLCASSDTKIGTSSLTQNCIAAFLRGAPGIDDRLVSGGAKAYARLFGAADCLCLSGGARRARFLSVHRTAPVCAGR